MGSKSLVTTILSLQIFRLWTLYLRLCQGESASAQNQVSTQSYNKIIITPLNQEDVSIWYNYHHQTGNYLAWVKKWSNFLRQFLNFFSTTLDLPSHLDLLVAHYVQTPLPPPPAYRRHTLNYTYTVPYG